MTPSTISSPGGAPLRQHHPRPIAGFFIVSMMIVALTAPLMFLTPWFEQLDAALVRTGIQPSTDYVTAVRLMLAAPEAVPGVLFAVLQPFAPDVAAYIMMLSVFGFAGVAALTRKYRFWAPEVGARRGMMLWVSCVLLMCGISVLTALLNAILLPAGQLTWSIAPATTGFWLGLLIAMFLDAGAVAEETGWRGFALPLLQAKMSPFAATTVLSILWGVWHIPVKIDILAEKGLLDFMIYFALFMFRMFLVSVIITYFFNSLGGSTFVAIAIHGLHNDSLKLMGRVADESSHYFAVEVAMILPLLIAAAWLLLRSKGKLGFQERLRHQVTFS